MTDEPPAMPKDPDAMIKVLEIWVDSDSKVRLLVFFRQNPGIIETLEGLAQRLAIPLETLSKEVRAHLEIGLLQSREMAGGKTVYYFDRARWEELEGAIATVLDHRRAGDA